MTVEIYAKGLCYCSVCTDVEDVEELTRQVNAELPTGVTPWVVSEEKFRDGSPNPQPCQGKSGFRHFLMVC